MDRADVKLLCMLLGDGPFFCYSDRIEVCDGFGNRKYIIMRESGYDDLVNKTKGVGIK